MVLTVSESRMPQRKVCYYCRKELLHFIVRIIWLVLINFSIRLHMPSSSTIYIKICVTCLPPPSLWVLFSHFLLFVHYTKRRVCWFGIFNSRATSCRDSRKAMAAASIRFHQLSERKCWKERRESTERTETSSLLAAFFSPFLTFRWLWLFALSSHWVWDNFI